MSLEVNMNTQTKRSTPKYILEFKQDAARLINEKGYTHQQVVGHGGISLSATGRWSRAKRSPAASSSGKNVMV
jgi:transposase